MTLTSKRVDCPKCGVRSSGRIVAWRLLESDDEVEQFEKVTAVSPSRGIETRSGTVVVEKERGRVHVAEESSEETYRCLRCGQTWTSKAVEQRRAGLV